MPSKVQKPAPVVIEAITENTAKPPEGAIAVAKPVAKEIEAKTVAKEIEAKPVKASSVPVIRTKIKAPKSPYTAYISKNFKEYKGTGKSNGEIFKELAGAWKTLTKEQKDAYKV